MVRISEKKLQQWESNPVQYRHEIIAADRRLFVELRKQVNGNSARRRVTTDAEYLAELRGETFFAKLISRISRMVTAIAKADHERWKRQQQRRSATSNDPQVMVAAAEQYEMQLMMKRYLTIGEA